MRKGTRIAVRSLQAVAGVAALAWLGLAAPGKAQEQAPAAATSEAPTVEPAEPRAVAPAPSAGDVQPQTMADLVSVLEAGEAEIADIRARAADATGDRGELLRPQLAEVQTRYRRMLNEAAVELTGEEPLPGSEQQTKAAHDALVEQLAAETRLIRSDVQRDFDRIFALTAKLEEAKAEERPQLDQERSAVLAAAPSLLGDLDANLKARGLLGDDIAREQNALKELLTESAKLASGLLHNLADETERLKQALDGEPTPDQTAELTAVEDVRSLVAELQRKHLSMMDELGLDTAQYRQDLISATGEVSEDILDADVATGLVAKWRDDAVDWLSENASTIVFRAAAFFAVLLLFVLLARLTRWLTRRAVDRSGHVSKLAGDFFVTMSGRLVLLVGLIIAAAQIGIEVGPLLAGLGIAGFVLGFALQDTLSNFASGMMILVYRPFDVGDVVEAGGVMGKVEAMNLVSTSILTFDNQMMIVPNGKIWGDVIRNVTHQPTRRVDFTFGISYADDVDQARALLEEIVKSNEQVLEDPAPVVRLHELGDSSVNFIVRPWVKTEDYWDVYWAITREVKQRFDADGVSIPFPQRDVHIYEERLAERRVPRHSDVAPKPAEGERSESRELDPPSEEAGGA